ncbi:MAG: dihydrolipoyl dehydrogenase [Pseudomonadota bacterium]|nr:dihydrolipoyl dehydrogenase [Pseudomonadota bacterium]
MKKHSVNVVIIGAGTAGLAAYRAVKTAGMQVVLVEGGVFGTTCARVGCMPSKLLIAAAESAHEINRWNRFGLKWEGKLKVDGHAVMERVRRERDRFVGFVLDSVSGIPEEELLRGRAVFENDHCLNVGEHARVEFDQAVIATGSSPYIPPLLRNLGDRLVVNDDIFEWETLPRSVAVFGLGVIGLELGQALHRLGVRVRFFSRGTTFGNLSDPEIRQAALEAFKAELAIEEDCVVENAVSTEDNVIIYYRNSHGVEHEERFEYVFAATGRRPNVDSLGLRETSLKLDGVGVPFFNLQTGQCNQSHVFIAGDATGELPLLHEAADEGRIAGENAARFPNVLKFFRRTPLNVVFSDPGLAVVGTRYADLCERSFVTGSVSFEDQGRSRIILKNQGRLNVYVDRIKGRILGAEMVGPAAEHLGHLLAWAVQDGMTVSSALEKPFYHPVVEEGLRTALRDAYTKLSV